MQSVYWKTKHCIDLRKIYSLLLVLQQGIYQKLFGVMDRCDSGHIFFQNGVIFCVSVLWDPTE
jgi:hypothetical protein